MEFEALARRSKNFYYQWVMKNQLVYKGDCFPDLYRILRNLLCVNECYGHFVIAL